MLKDKIIRLYIFVTIVYASSLAFYTHRIQWVRDEYNKEIKELEVQIDNLTFERNSCRLLWRNYGH